MSAEGTPARIELLDAAVPGERRRWIDIWTAWPEREPTAHPGYGELFAERGERMMCAVLRTEQGDGGMLFPHILRPLGEGLHDLTTPYGYGGPRAWGRLADADVEEFWREFDAWGEARGIVSEFVRFTVPLDEVARYPGEIVSRGPNVVVPLSGTRDDRWRSFEHKVRKNVNRARRDGVTVEFDASGDRIDEFLAVYDSTMARRGAARRYRWDRSFFAAMAQSLRGGVVFAIAMLDGRAVSAELVLTAPRRAYSFLGGTIDEAMPHRPNDLLKVEVMNWASERGMSEYVLGGGLVPGDGIERYKRSFAPDGIVGYATGERVRLPAVYDRLVRRRRAEFDALGARWPTASASFPLYRLEADR